MEDGGSSEVHFFDSKSEALSIVEHFTPGDVVLLKASRSEEFNLLADLIQERLQEADK
jgi:UDP-N-acetylmuramyl pentapeptide synthase